MTKTTLEVARNARQRQLLVHFLTLLGFAPWIFRPPFLGRMGGLRRGGLKRQRKPTETEPPAKQTQKRGVSRPSGHRKPRRARKVEKIHAPEQR